MRLWEKLFDNRYSVRILCYEIYGGNMDNNSSIEQKSKFSLIELLMIIMIVGIVFTLIIPIRTDRVNQEKVKEAIKNLQIIARADVAWKNDVDGGDGSYMFEHTVVRYEPAAKDSMGNIIPPQEAGEDLLYVADKLEKTGEFFFFDYAITDSSVVAISNQNFGTEGVKIQYFLPRGPFQAGKDAVTKSIIDVNWLP